MTYKLGISKKVVRASS